MTSDQSLWWRDGVLYQIYPRSFADSNGDGVGDLRGIIENLDYLKWLGVDGIWINPITVSPDDDWGYDVADYCNVQPVLGDLDDVDALVTGAGERGMHVILDLAPNHTSDRHPWFVDGLSGSDAKHRDWYVWADPKPDGSPPNNWVSTFGGPAWEYHETSGQYYLHNFLPSQPDLNWWNDDVRNAFDEILRFWFDRGISGFRIDVAHAIIKDAKLRDNLPATEEDHPTIRRLGQQHTHNMDQPEVHDVIRRWRRLADEYKPKRVLIGETFLMDIARMVKYYGRGDELNLAFNFPFVLSSFDAKVMREAVELTERLLPEAAWPAWFGSNHDVLRFPTRWCDRDPRKTRLAALCLLTMRGTPFLYYGDEIGMTDVAVPEDAVLDPVAKRRGAHGGRDPARTPMQWRAAPGAGFTSSDTRPWLPLGDYERINVESQREDPASMLTLTRDLIRLRKASPDLTSGTYSSVEASEETWVYRRGEGTLVALNMSDDDNEVEGISGQIGIGTDRGRDGEVVTGALFLRPWEGTVVATAAPRE
jgi:alpha-glucosidase